MKDRIICPSLEELRRLDDERLAILHTDCVEQASNVEGQIRNIRAQGEEPRSAILNVRDVYQRCIRNIRNVQSERRTDRSEQRRPYDALYDAVKAWLESDEDDDHAEYDAMLTAYKAIPVPHRHQREKVA